MKYPVIGVRHLASIDDKENFASSCNTKTNILG